MSRFNICVLIPHLPEQPHETEEDIRIECEKQINERLEKFNVNHPVTPYKRRLTQEEINQMSHHYTLTPSHLQELAEKISDWCGGEGGVDEQGLYQRTTQNPESHLDY